MESKTKWERVGLLGPLPSARDDLAKRKMNVAMKRDNFILTQMQYHGTR